MTLGKMLSNPFLFTLLRILPASVASWLGGWLSANVARRNMKLRDQRARANLAILRPDLDEATREEMLTRRWINLGRTMAELTNIDRLIENDHITVEDAKGYDEVLAGPGPMIALAVHIGNWDLLAAQAAMLKRARSSYMGEAITGDGAARGILKHLTTKDRATLYILLDERRDRQVWFPRFGRDLPPSGNLSVALRLGRKVGAKFLPFYLIRTTGPNFRVHWHPPLDPAQLTDDQIMDQVDAFLGKACIDHADQWLALHDMDLTV
jgi:KDO2-lipid IV(A) lauroyltransferase